MQYAPMPPPPPPKASDGSWVFVLLAVLGGGVILVGILATLAISGVRRYLVNAKQAEARNELGEIARDAVAAYEAKADDSTHAAKLCESASRSVPASVHDVSGKKYMSAPSEWTIDAARGAGFACLGFSMSTPQYYVYDYKATATALSATAEGDLDGDGVSSKFELRGAVRSGALLLAPSMMETLPDE